MTVPFGRVRPWIAAAVAVLLLDAAVTFENVWPTPAVRWTGAISIELAVVVLALALSHALNRSVSRAALWWLSALWMLLTIGRYAEVTAPALYGRDVNLYWDARFIPDVAAMVIRVAPLWMVIGAVAAAAVVLWLVHFIVRWSFARINDVTASPPARRLLSVLAIAAVAGFVIGRFGSRAETKSGHVLFPQPVVETYAHQLTLVVRAVAKPKTLPPSPAMPSAFARVRGADVFLVFIESYGAISYAPRLAADLAPARAQLQADIDATGRLIASALVRSPTFGGSSWLAHITLLSGIEVREPDTNALLMTQHRDTLVKAFSRAGFRTVGLMPGLRQRWPEGAFYGFDEIYGADALAYRGPEFGWFAIPDQFALARFDELEAKRTAQPRFVMFPTISTHFPFRPTPPYQPDWTRMMLEKPYDGPSIVRAYARQPDWVNFVPGYVEAISYDFAVLGGYLRRHADRDLVMILIGDHQPPAAVSGPGAGWDVPVHVIASRRPILDRLIARGFRAGLQPDTMTLGSMHELLPILVDAFGDGP